MADKVGTAFRELKKEIPKNSKIIKYKDLKMLKPHKNFLLKITFKEIT